MKLDDWGNSDNHRKYRLIFHCSSICRIKSDIEKVFNYVPKVFLFGQKYEVERWILIKMQRVILYRKIKDL